MFGEARTGQRSPPGPAAAAAGAPGELPVSRRSNTPSSGLNSAHWGSEKQILAAAGARAAQLMPRVCLCCQSGGTGESRAELPTAPREPLPRHSPDPPQNLPGVQGLRAGTPLDSRTCLCVPSKARSQDSDMQDLEHPCSIPTARCPWVAGLSVGQEEEQEPVLGSSLSSFPGGSAAPVLRGTIVAPAPCRARLGCSRQLQRSPAGPCQAGDGCQPRGHHWAHGRSQRARRRGVGGPWARSVGSPAPRKARNMPSANGAVMGTQRLIGAGINI